MNLHPNKDENNSKWSWDILGEEDSIVLKEL